MEGGDVRFGFVGQEPAFYSGRVERPDVCFPMPSGHHGEAGWRVARVGEGGPLGGLRCRWWMQGRGPIWNVLLRGGA